MFSSLKSFYRRNRQKILVSGVAVGGIYAAGKYALYKYDEWQNVKMEEDQREARKQFHFESHQRTCTSTFVSFLPNIRNAIMEKMDTEQLLEILKLKPANKLEIWDQLKTFSLSRLLCSVFANVMLLVILKVKMNIIGAYLFAVMSSRSNTKSTDFDIAPINPNATPLGTSNDLSVSDNDPVLSDEENNTNNNDEDMNELQLRYLNNIRYLIEESLPSLIDECHDVVEHCLSKITLKDKLSHDKLKEICIDAMTKLKARHASLNNVKHEFCTYIVDPAWNECEENTDIYSRIVYDTVNVLESIDCSLVIDKCLQCGLDQALDNFKDSFKSCAEPENNLTLSECLTKDFGSTELHVAKIIPILNNQIHEIFKVGSNGFLDALFSQDLLRQLSRNVYESTIKEYSSCTI